MTLKICETMSSDATFNVVVLSEAEVNSMSNEQITAFVTDLLKQQTGTFVIPRKAFYKKTCEINDSEIYSRLHRRLRQLGFMLQGSEKETKSYYKESEVVDVKGHFCPKTFIFSSVQDYTDTVNSLSEGAHLVLRHFHFHLSLPEKVSKEQILELLQCNYVLSEKSLREKLVNKYVGLSGKWPLESMKSVIKCLELCDDTASACTILQKHFYITDDNDFVQMIQYAEDVRLKKLLTTSFLGSKSLKYKESADGIEVSFDAFRELFSTEKSEHFKKIVIEQVDKVSVSDISPSQLVALHAIDAQYRNQILFLSSVDEPLYPGLFTYFPSASFENTYLYDKGYYRGDSSSDREWVPDEYRKEVITPEDRIYHCFSFKEKCKKISIKESMLDSKIDSHPNVGALYELKGKMLYQRGDYSKAKTCFEKAFEINPKSVSANAHLAEIYRLEKDVTKALEHIKRALCRGQTDAFCRKVQAVVNISVFREPLVRDGSFYTLSENELKNIENCVKDIQSKRFMRLFDTDTYHKPFVLGVVAFYRGKFSEAKELLDKAYSVKKTDEIAAFLGAANYYVHNYKGAEAVLSTIKEKDLFAKRFYGAALYLNGKFEAARDFLLEVAQAATNDTLSIMYLGATLYHLGEVDKAVGWLEQVKEENFVVDRYLGALYYHQGKKDEAKTRLEKAIGFSSQDQFCVQYLAVISYEKQEKEEAEKYLQRACPDSWTSWRSRFTLTERYQQVRAKLPFCDQKQMKEMVQQFEKLNLRSISR